MSIFRTTIVLGMITAFANVAHAQEAEFSEIDVSIQVGDPNTSNALRFWPMIEPDMEAIMKQRISTIYNPNGLNVNIVVGEISADGTKLLSDQGEFNTLRGVAIIREDENGPVVKAVEFGLRAQPWETSIKDGMFVLPEKPEFYVALLNHFADEMVTEINND